MNQDAFRSLLTSNSIPNGQSSGSRKVLGVPAPKRGWGLKPKAGKDYSGPAEESSKDTQILAPRVHQKKLNHGEYKDRAEMRRQGVDDEYKPVERLLEDFERRAVEAGDKEEDIEKSRQYLGGDATHSILVKGLDFSLLAARKAELAREREEVNDEELDALLKREEKPKVEGEKPKASDEVFSKGFRSINANPTEPPKKKKKMKKVKKESDEAVAGVAGDVIDQDNGSVKTEPIVRPSPRISAPSPKPEASSTRNIVEPPPDEDDDIFGDVGAYDLDPAKGGGSSDDESDSEYSEAVKRGRSPSPIRNGREERSSKRYRESSYEEARPRHRSQSDDRRRRYRDDSYDRSRRERPREDSYDRRSRSRDRRRYHSRSYSPSPPRRRRSPPRSHRRRYSPSPPRSYDRQGSPSPPHYSKRQHEHPADRYPGRRPAYSRSPPSSRRHSPSPSPKRDRAKSPSPRRSPRRQSTSPQPIFDPYAGLSRSPSPSSDDQAGPSMGKLQPLSSSAMADVRGFLSADASATKADEKKLRKAKLRASQGLAPQEGAEQLMDKKMNEKQKANREYVLLRNRLNKDKGGEGA